MKKHFRVVLIMVLTCANLIALAQSEIKVYLKNGGVLIGELENIEENGDIKIKLNDKTVLLNANTIKKYYFDGRTKHHKEDKFYRRFKFHTDASLLFGEYHKGFGIRQMVNYNLFHSLYAGLSFGVDNYQENAELNVYTLGVNTRYYFKKLPKHPYISMNAGYGSFNASKQFNQTKDRGGLYWNPSVGFSFGSTISIDVSAGLKFQNSGITYFIGETESDINWKYKRLNFNVGITF